MVMLIFYMLMLFSGQDMGTRALWRVILCHTACPIVHVLTSIASIANTLYIIKLLYNSTVSRVTDAISNS